MTMRPHGRVVLVASAWVLAGSLMVACGGGDGDGASPDGGQAGPEGIGGRDGGEPAADDVDAVLPYLEDLLAEHDRVVAEILADPSVAEDPDGSLIGQYRDLFVPDSELPDRVIAAWADEAAAGRTVEPYDDQHPVVETFVDGEVEVVDDDEVRVPTCEVRRERTYVDGELTGGVPMRESASETVAVRVDGRWRISSRQIDDGAACEGGAA
jgi:hypothetical protein